MTVNLKLYILTLTFGLLCCNGKTKEVIDRSSVSKVGDDAIKLHELKKLFVVGDFDNGRESDTIYQHNYSRLTRAEISRSPDPFQNEWEVIVKWFYDQNSDLYLTINKYNQDTLHLGLAQGLYCLINIGDNNSDGKDEIAFVVDYCDFSNMNSCKIYSLCSDKWELLKEFEIHEGSFNWTTEQVPIFDNIKNYLEKRDGKWVYMDYLADEIQKPDSIGEMKTLHIEKCK